MKKFKSKYKSTYKTAQFDNKKHNRCDIQKIKFLLLEFLHQI